MGPLYLSLYVSLSVALSLSLPLSLSFSLLLSLIHSAPPSVFLGGGHAEGNTEVLGGAGSGVDGRGLAQPALNVVGASLSLSLSLSYYLSLSLSLYLYRSLSLTHTHCLSPGGGLAGRNAEVLGGARSGLGGRGLIRQGGTFPGTGARPTHTLTRLPTHRPIQPPTHTHIHTHTQTLSLSLTHAHARALFHMPITQNPHRVFRSKSQNLAAPDVRKEHNFQPPNPQF